MNFKKYIQSNTHVSKLPKISDIFFKKNSFSIICENMKNGGFSLVLVSFNVIIMELSNDGSLGIGSNFSNCDTSHNGITRFNGSLVC